MSQKVDDARKAIEIARDYAKRSMLLTYWKDTLSCELEEETGDWQIVFEASPSTLSPYFTYEITIDRDGRVKKAKRIEQ